jgi:negative regulator of replication initiation
MKTIEVSDETFAAIRARGKFGETTEEDVLRRILKISTNNSLKNDLPTNETAKQYGWKERRTVNRMTQDVRGNKLILQFDHGPQFEKVLPEKKDRLAIRKVRDEAIEFVRANGGTKGQEHAAIRALTSRGYHVAKVDISEFI